MATARFLSAAFFGSALRPPRFFLLGFLLTLPLALPFLLPFFFFAILLSFQPLVVPLTDWFFPPQSVEDSKRKRDQACGSGPMNDRPICRGQFKLGHHALNLGLFFFGLFGHISILRPL